MRRLLMGVSVAALSVAAIAEKARVPAPPLEAREYAMHQTIDGVTVAAEPCMSKETRPDTRLDYAARGMLPVRVIVTNNTNKTVTLDDARIHFVTADNTVLQAATDDDLQRRMFETKQIAGTKIPLIPVTIHHKPVSQKIVLDGEDFGFKTTTVAPNTTVSGYLYYDMQGLSSPVLEHATLELRKVKLNAEYMDSFEIALKTEAK